MPKQITVTLGGQSYVIEALPIAASKAWRAKLAGPFGQLAATLAHAGEIDLTDGGALSNLIQVVSDTLLGSIDLLQDLLFAYSPVLAADRARIEATAYDDEAMHALVEVLKLAYPFGGVLTLVSGATKAPTT